MGEVEHNGRAIANRGTIGSVTRLEPDGGSQAREMRPDSPEVPVAVVSDGSHGLGLQVVRMLAEQPMRVVLASRSVATGRAALESLGDLAERVAVRQLDVTDAASVVQLATWLRRRLRRCDVLVNNATVPMYDDTDAVAVDLDVVHQTLATNLLGTWRLTQAIVPVMRLRGHGCIVNITSSLGGVAVMRRGLAAHRLAMSTVNALTRMLAHELAEDGILVNAYCPGAVGAEVGDEGRGTRSSVAADTPVWLATLPDGGPSGRCYCGRAPVDW